MESSESDDTYDFEDLFDTSVHDDDDPPEDGEGFAE